MTTNFLPDSLIVKLNETASPSEINNLRAEMGVLGVKQAKLSKIEIWKIAPGTVLQKIAAHATDRRVQYIEPDYNITVPIQTTSPTQQNLATITPQTTTPNDPDYPLLWGLNNTGQTGGKPDADIDAPEAWNIQTGNHIVVGVIDSGVDYTHPDLAANIAKNLGETAGDGIDNDNNGYIDDVHGWDFASNDNDPMDGNGHGTHVAGTIASIGNNNLGVIGVAWQKAKILPLKFLGDDGSGSTSSAILAIDYATANGVKVTNNSWGGGGYSQALYDAINTAGQQGGVFITAAGNDSLSNEPIIPIPLPIIPFPAYPASYDLPHIISVASTDHKDKYSSFTNHGATTVDLAAPGSDIRSTLPKGAYGLLSGTSMASPHVAGAVALMLSQNPSLTAQQVKNRLLQTTDPISDLLLRKTVSNGRLNIHKALLGGSTPNNNSNLGQTQLRIASTLSPAAPANLTETANGETEADPLTGGTGADTLMLPFAESSVSAMDPVTYFGSQKTDFLTEGGAMMNAPTLFSPAVNSAAPTLEKDVMPVFTQAKGALAGNEALGIKSDPLAVAKTSPFADSYLLGIYDAIKSLGIEVA